MQFHKCQKHFSLELLFDKLPNPFNGTLVRGYGLVDKPESSYQATAERWSHEHQRDRVESGFLEPLSVFGTAKRDEECLKVWC